MDIFPVYLTLFLWKLTTSIPLPPETTTMVITETTTPLPPLPDHVVRMGQSLSSIPFGGENVKSINFGYNQISSLYPYIFCINGYQYLQRIEMIQNRIFNVSRKAFRELKQLKVVDLSGNNISFIETSTFKGNPKLEKLDLSNNRINFHPSKAFLNAPSLETLILTENKIERIFEITFCKLPKLRNLMMDNNIIFLIDPQSFAPMKHLQYLSLAYTGVYKLSEVMFRNNQSYPRVIDLTDTPLANKFDPPLRKVKHNAVTSLLKIDEYF